jgi:hypothetical protein
LLNSTTSNSGVDQTLGKRIVSLSGWREIERPKGPDA